MTQLQTELEWNNNNKCLAQFVEYFINVLLTFSSVYASNLFYRISMKLFYNPKNKMNYFQIN